MVGRESSLMLAELFLLSGSLVDDNSSKLSAVVVSIVVGEEATEEVTHFVQLLLTTFFRLLAFVQTVQCAAVDRESAECKVLAV